MKKKILSILLAVVLVFSLSVTAMAAGTTQRPNLAAGEKAAQSGDPSQVNALLTTVMTNRASILAIKSQNVTLAIQLRTILTELKSSGASIPEETLALLTALKDQLKAVHEQLAATRGQLDGLMTAYREYRQQRDFENAAAILQQVITIQQSRIASETQIGALTQDMINLLNGI